jgi:hypothetical protein
MHQASSRLYIEYYQPRITQEDHHWYSMFLLHALYIGTLNATNQAYTRSLVRKRMVYSPPIGMHILDNVPIILMCDFQVSRSQQDARPVQLFIKDPAPKRPTR